MTPERASPMHTEDRFVTPGPSGYAELAALLTYPDGETLGQCTTWLEAWGERRPVAAGLLCEWRDFAASTPLWELQEVYTRTFDLNPSCSLDVGYYLFGEDYQRGAFMALVRQELDRVGLPRDAELPDHLPNLLRWMEMVFGQDGHVEMVSECLLPVLEKMDRSFDARAASDSSVSARAENPYRLLIRAVRDVLDSDLRDLGVVHRPEPTSAETPAAMRADGMAPCRLACAARGSER